MKGRKHLQPVGDDVGAVAELVQHPPNHLLVHHVVLGDQHALGLHLCNLAPELAHRLRLGQW